MKECHFCGNKEQDKLKSIWLEEDVENDVYRTDEEREKGLPERSCCRNCFNDPDNSMDVPPIDSMEWYSTDYDWKTKTHAGEIQN